MTNQPCEGLIGASVQAEAGVAVQNGRDSLGEGAQLTYSEKVHMSGQAYREMALAEMAHSTTFFGNAALERARRQALLSEDDVEAGSTPTRGEQLLTAWTLPPEVRSVLSAVLVCDNHGKGRGWGWGRPTLVQTASFVLVKL